MQFCPYQIIVYLGISTGHIILGMYIVLCFMHGSIGVMPQLLILFIITDAIYRG